MHTFGGKKLKKKEIIQFCGRKQRNFCLFNYLLYSINVIQCHPKYRADNNVVKNATKCGAKEQRHLQYYNKYYPFLYQQLYWKRLDLLYSLQLPAYTSALEEGVWLLVSIHAYCSFWKCSASVYRCIEGTPHQCLEVENYSTARVYVNCADEFHTLRRRVVRCTYTIFFACTVEKIGPLVFLCYSVL